MAEKTYKFFPDLKCAIFQCSVILVAILINIYFLLDGKNFILIMLLIIFLAIFGSLFLAITRNQKIIITGDYLTIYSFGKENNLKFSKDLFEVVSKNDDIVSYRFEKDGNYYQISPKAYPDKKLGELLKLKLKSGKLTVSIIER